MSRPRTAVLTVLTSLLFTALVPAQPAAGADAAPFTRKEDVVYGRKYGTALTMDVFTPKANANGAGAIFVVSGGWFSAHEAITPAIPTFINEFLKRGYVVFAVVHGSQPRYVIPEVLQDMNRAVRFIRFHAKDYAVDPDRLAIYGASAGGHLSLMQGLAGDKGNPGAPDPLDRTPSRVRVVGCFFPPTDFLNYGKEGENALGRGVLAAFKAPFDFHELDKKTNTFVPITDEQKILEIGRQISPINHVSADAPPTLIIHGDADKLVPIQQAQIIIEKLKGVGVPAELSVKAGAAHGWPDITADMKLLADWFDKYLKAHDAPPAPAKAE